MLYMNIETNAVFIQLLEQLHNVGTVIVIYSRRTKGAERLSNLPKVTRHRGLILYSWLQTFCS